MTPNFALNMSEDGLSLLHRAANGAGWVEIGRVALDTADLAADLSALRNKAEAIEGPGFTTKLILPPSQLLYATITVDDNLDAEVASALEERTPYSADQLSYDISGTPPEVQVVAVARDTLAEAEGFIGPYGFNAVGFTAVPDPDHFAGEPMLGAMPGSGAKFAPDAEPVKIISADAAAVMPSAAELDLAPIPETVEDPETEHAQPELDPAPVLPEDQPEPATEAAPSSNTPAAFSSRRKPTLGPAMGTGDRVAGRAARIGVATTPEPPKPAKAKKAPRVEPRIKTGEAAKAKPAPPIVPPATPAEPKRKSQSRMAAGLSSLKDRKVAKAKAKTQATPEKVDVIADLAARQAQGKPRFLGLILTGILLVALLIFAALSSYLLPEETIARLLGRDAPEAIEQVEAEAPVIADLEVEDIFAAHPEPDAPVFTIPSPEEIAEAEDPEPEIIAPSRMTDTDAQTAYAVTGIWQLPPEQRPSLAEQNLDALYENSLDPELAFEDAPALASFNSGAALGLAVPVAPPPAAILFNLDERGLVIPSPEGSLNPDGILVFSGPPPVAAVQRPDGLVPDTPVEIEGAEVEAVEVEVEEDAPVVDQRLAGFRPTLRPADLQERFERANQGGRTTSELASFRPQQRPQSAIDRLREEAIAKALAEAAADAQQAEDRAAAEAAAQAELDKPTAQAVARSTRPGTRPRNFARIVARAKREPAKARNPAAAASTASVARATGPAVARASRASPTGTTRASVARAATDNNAISLGRVALVGVFGTSSNRRALVRMPNGRFKKVAVGDRVDGGRVAAIGEGQLKYTKGGRTLTLDMPKG